MIISEREMRFVPKNIFLSKMYCSAHKCTKLLGEFVNSFVQHLHNTLIVMVSSKPKYAC